MTHVGIISAASILISLISPVLLLPVEGEKSEEPLVVFEERAPQQNKEKQSILLSTGSGIEELGLEEYLVGVVLSEMPPSFHKEALKAQAVAARTFTLHQKNRKHVDFDLCDDSSCCQAWSDCGSLELKLGNSYEKYWQKAAQAVCSTKGEVLTYNGELIEAVYFSCSGGRTESAVAVWGTDVPYLKSVISEGEEEAAKYETQVAVPLEVFRSSILDKNRAAQFSVDSQNWITQVIRSEGGGVEHIRIGGQWFSGIQLRQMFGLASANFTMTTEEEQIVFSVRGYGHRVGMSQYGANAMAEEGKSYQEILLHYYTGVEIEKCSDQ